MGVYKDMWLCAGSEKYKPVRLLVVDSKIELASWEPIGLFILFISTYIFNLYVIFNNSLYLRNTVLLKSVLN